MYGLLGVGENVEDVWKDACESQGLKIHYQLAPVLGCSEPSRLPIVPNPLFWDMVRENPEQRFPNNMCGAIEQAIAIVREVERCSRTSGDEVTDSYDTRMVFNA